MPHFGLHLAKAGQEPEETAAADSIPGSQERKPGQPQRSTFPPSGNVLPQQETLGALPAHGLLLPATATGAREVQGRGLEVPWPRESFAGAWEEREDFAAQWLSRSGCSNHTLSHLISHVGKRKGI